MAMKKPSDLTSGLVATKGLAAPAPAMQQPAGKPKMDDDSANNVPLNFRVSPDLRRRFRMFAAAHDLKLNELLRLAFTEYETRHGSQA